MEKCKQMLTDSLKRFKNASFLSKCDIISFVSLCVFFFDCSLSGGGHYISVGPLTLRMFFGFLALFTALPSLLKNFRKHILNPINICVLLFVAYMAFCAIRGYLAGNRTDVIISDIKGFMWLFLVPVLIATVNSAYRFKRITDFIIAGAFLQGCLVLVINAICVIVPDGIRIFYDPLMDTLMGSVSNVSGTIYRLFMKSSPYMALAVSVAVYRQLKEKRLKPFYVTVIAVCLNALLFSFTRSIYGGVFVVLASMVFVCLFFLRKYFKRCVAVLLITLLITAGCVIVQEFTFGGNYINFAISRTFNTEPVKSPVLTARSAVIDFFNSFGEGGTQSGLPGGDDIEEQMNYIERTEESDNFRAQTKKELTELIVKNPVIGNGLGAAAPCRPNGLDEYFYLDVLARMGVIGLVLYILPFGYIVLKCLKYRKKMSERLDICGVLCGMIGFWAVTWFNPWMNAVLGIACYALCAAIPQILEISE